MKPLKTKRSIVVEALINGDYKKALEVAKSFNVELNKEQNTIVRRAYEMTWNPGFYEQLGFNAEEEYQKAVAILKEVYDIN